MHQVLDLISSTEWTGFGDTGRIPGEPEIPGVTSYLTGFRTREVHEIPSLKSVFDI